MTRERILFITLVIKLTSCLAGDGIYDNSNNAISTIERNTDQEDLDLIDMRVPIDKVYMALRSPIVIDHRGERNQYLDVVDIGDGWTHWSQWSSCSKSCGVGLNQRLRKCLKRTKDEFTIACKGRSSESMVCNQEACNEETRDFRQHQCSQHDDTKLFGLRKFTWDAFYGLNVPPCVITCIARQFNFFHSFGLALDGTSCGRDRRGVCFGGQCRSVGCDGVLDSKVIFDACGVCGGDNTTCYHFQRVFDEFDSDVQVAEYGYNNITVIPAGATTVSIKDYTRNYIVLTEIDGDYESYVINGNSIISSPGVFDIAGSVMEYKITGGDEVVEFDGPTTRDIRVLLFYFGDKPLTVYDYWLPIQVQPTNKEMITEFKIVREMDAMERLELAGVDVNIVPLPTEPTTTSTLPPTTTSTRKPTTTARPGKSLTCYRAPCKPVLPAPCLSFSTGAVYYFSFMETQLAQITPTAYRRKIPYCGCKGHLHRRRKFCNSDFVVQVTILYKQRVLGRYIRYAVEISRIFKSTFTLLKREYVWFSSTCCSRLRIHQRYLLMGRKIRFNFRKNNNVINSKRRTVFTRLVVDNVDYWYPWRKTYQRKLRRFAHRINCKKHKRAKKLQNT